MKQQRALLLLLLLSILKLRVHRQNVNIYQHDAKLHSAASMQSTDREGDSHISFEIVTNNIENQMQQLTTEKREVQLMFIKHNHF